MRYGANHRYNYAVELSIKMTSIIITFGHWRMAEVRLLTILKFDFIA